MGNMNVFGSRAGGESAILTEDFSGSIQTIFFFFLKKRYRDRILGCLEYWVICNTNIKTERLAFQQGVFLFLFVFVFFFFFFFFSSGLYSVVCMYIQ